MAVNEKLRDHLHDQLFAAVLELQSIDECYEFFEDICTIQEMRAIAVRLEVARMLKAGDIYEDIVKQTGASTATISRIKRCLNYGSGGYGKILDRMAEALGDERARRFHVHFSRIEYSKGGEKRHWTFAETQFGPEPQPLMELLAERKLQPVIICESAGTQAEDAGAMQQMYHAACKT